MVQFALVIPCASSRSLFFQTCEAHNRMRAHHLATNSLHGLGRFKQVQWQCWRQSTDRASPERAGRPVCTVCLHLVRRCTHTPAGLRCHSPTLEAVIGSEGCREFRFSPAPTIEDQQEFSGIEALPLAEVVAGRAAVKAHCALLRRGFR